MHEQGLCKMKSDKYPSTDRGRVHKVPPIAKALPTIGGCCRKGNPFFQRCTTSESTNALIDNPEFKDT